MNRRVSRLATAGTERFDSAGVQREIRPDLLAEVRLDRALLPEMLERGGCRLPRDFDPEPFDASTYAAVEAALSSYTDSRDSHTSSVCWC
ncbi:hypothetical protein [Marinobacter sp.]|uniref:hypothetical protein n=1 Tax=Marinobacter sp. TaxID=50741 RepID=UPI003A93E4C3